MFDIHDPEDRARFLAPGLAVAATAGLTAGLLPLLVARVAPLIEAQLVVDATLAVAAGGLAVAVVVWIGFHLVYVCRHVAERSLAYLPLLFAVALGIDASALFVQKIVTERAAVDSRPLGAADTSDNSDPAAMQTALAESNAAMRAVALRIGGIVPVHFDGPGLASAFGRATKTMLDNVGAALAAQNKEIDAVGFPRFLSGFDLKARGGYRRAHEKFERMRAIRVKYDRMQSDAVARYRAWIAAAPLDADAKRTALAQFDRWAALDARGRALQLSDADAFVDESEAMLRDLQRSAWMTKGQTLYFRDGRDANAYQAHLNASEADLRRLNAAIEGKSAPR